MEFPLRRHINGISNKYYLLESVLNVEPNIEKKKWFLPDNKIQKKTSVRIYYENNNTILKSGFPKNESWEYDILSDIYNEEARINTPGYGEKYSPKLYVNKYVDRFSFDIKPFIKGDNNKKLRELIYSNVQEARPAYISVSKSLYSFLLSLTSPPAKQGGEVRDNKKILDIAAYGERAIAAGGLNNIKIYDGIDPNPDLVKGHNEIKSDILKFRNNIIINFWQTTLEEFKPYTKYDIITLSPPPFNMEPYGKDSEKNQSGQTYLEYENFTDWFKKFIIQILIKSKLLLEDNGILAFTVLDRSPEMAKKRTPPKYLSENIEIYYTEPMLLYASILGFEFIEAAGINGVTPWWIFRSTQLLSPIELIKEFKKHYGELLYNNPLIKKTKVNIEHKYFSYEVYDYDTPNIHSEVIAYYIQKFIVEMFHSILSNVLNKNKVSTFLGRWTMIAKIADNESIMYSYVFPYTYNKIANEQLIDNLIYNKIDKKYANYIVNEKTYYLDDMFDKGIDGLYRMAGLLHSRWNLNKSDIEALRIENNIDIKINSLDIPKEYYYNNKNIRLKMPESLADKKYGLELLLRLETEGALGHHFTRDIERSKILYEAFSEKYEVIDIFASYINYRSFPSSSLQSKGEEGRFGSDNYDIEKYFGSVGSALNLKIKKGVYLANPVAADYFVELAVKWMLEQLENTDDELIFVFGTTEWEDEKNKFIKQLKESKYYYYDYELSSKFKSVDPFLPAQNGKDQQKTIKRKGNPKSVGLILSTKKGQELIIREKLFELSSPPLKSAAPLALQGKEGGNEFSQLKKKYICYDIYPTLLSVHARTERSQTKNDEKIIEYNNRQYLLKLKPINELNNIFGERIKIEKIKPLTISLWNKNNKLGEYSKGILNMENKYIKAGIDIEIKEEYEKILNQLYSN